MRTPSRVGALAASLLLAGSLAACGGDTTDETPPTDDTTTEPDDGATDDGAMTDGSTVMTADSELGTILVDGDGMTLYLFTNDSPDTSVCEGDCLVAWPPLEGEATAGEGVDESLLGSFERSDGSTQASYNGWPLYYWAQDTEPGDVTGQGVNDVWWVVSPEGEPIGAEG
jgi:predicted lipoprotein with Yx(FWY)xxD motif